MEESPKTSTPEQSAPQLRGLYKNVNISVKSLNVIIVVCILAMLLLVAMELRDPGLTVTFDSKGGTDVAAQKQEYGELLVLPEPPTREGYQFTGWYTDHGCTILWDAAQQTIQSDMTLYAGWQTLP